MTTTKTTSARSAAQLLADQTWTEYQAIKDANGGTLANASDEDVRRALEIHSIYCAQVDAAEQQVNVKTNIRAIERALDCNSGEVETDFGIVRWSPTVIYGPPAALIEIADQVDEMAEDGAQSAADNAEREVPRAFVDRWVQASHRAAAQIREAAKDGGAK